MKEDKKFLSSVWPRVKSALSGKVDKVYGKGLSSNDFTTEEKDKLANMPDPNDFKIITNEEINSLFK